MAAETGINIMASSNDLKSARETYGSFISVIKWSTPALAVLVAFIIYLLKA